MKTLTRTGTVFFKKKNRLSFLITLVCALFLLGSVNVSAATITAGLWSVTDGNCTNATGSLSASLDQCGTGYTFSYTSTCADNTVVISYDGVSAKSTWTYNNCSFANWGDGPVKSPYSSGKVYMLLEVVGGTPKISASNAPFSCGAQIKVDKTSLTGFTTCSGTFSASQRVVVTPTAGLTGTTITVAAPAGYEYSVAGGEWGTSATISTTPASYNLDIRLAGTGSGSVGGTLSLSNAGATPNPVNITLTGTVNSLAITAPTSTINVSGQACPTTPSVSQSFTVNGTCFSGNITVNAPAGFAVSTTQGGTYSGSVSVAPGTTVWIQTSASATTGSKTGTLTFSNGGTTVGTGVTVNGTVGAPTLTAPAANVSVAAPACPTADSKPQSFVVNGTCFTGNNITVTLDNTNFTLSTSETGTFGSSVTVTAGSTVWVRTERSATTGSKSATLQFRDGGTAGTIVKTYTVSGNVVAGAILTATPANLTGLDAMYKTSGGTVAYPSSPKSFILEGLCFSGDVTISLTNTSPQTGSGNYELSTDPDATTWYSTLTVPQNATVYVRFKSGTTAVAAGNAGNATVTCTAGGATATVTLNGSRTLITPANFYSKASTAWNLTSTWGTSCGSGTQSRIPTIFDYVEICTHMVEVTADAQCRQLNITTGNNARVRLSNGTTLEVAENAQIGGDPYGQVLVTDNSSATFIVGGICTIGARNHTKVDLGPQGSLIAGSLVFVNGESNIRSKDITVKSGGLTLNNTATANDNHYIQLYTGGTMTVVGDLSLGHNGRIQMETNGSGTLIVSGTTTISGTRNQAKINLGPQGSFTTGGLVWSGEGNVSSKNVTVKSSCTISNAGGTNNNTYVNLYDGGLMRVEGSLTVGGDNTDNRPGNIRMASGNATLEVTQNLIIRRNNNNTNVYVNVGTGGTVRIGGNLEILQTNNNNRITTGTLEMVGCGQTINLGNTLTVTTFRQIGPLYDPFGKLPCTTSFTKTGSNLSFTTYDQSCHEKNLAGNTDDETTQTGFMGGFSGTWANRINIGVRETNIVGAPLDEFFVSEGCQFFTVTGNASIGSITVTAPDGFLISETEEGGYTEAGTISWSSNLTTAKHIYVHMVAAAVGVNRTGTLTVTAACAAGSSCPAKVESIALSGTGEGWLPIELAEFTAGRAGSTIVLNWTTLTETNNEYFTVQRSGNGSIFENLAEIFGAGTTTVPQYYSYIDNAPLAGVSYYRLKQTDFNGEYSYSYIVPVYFQNAAKTFEVFKTQSNGITRLECKFANVASSNYVIVHSVTGRSEFEKMVAPHTPAYVIELPLPPGVYLVSNVSNGVKTVVKVLVTN